MDINMNQSSARNQAYDLMRIVAALSVIVMHVTVNNMYSSPMESAKWVGSMALNSVSHFGVPVFVMISGALFLAPNREPDIKRIWLHNILRMSIVLIVWSVFYGVTDYLEYRAEPVFIVREIIDGRQHLWFIPMLLGLYMIQPILLRWLKSASVKEVRYFLLMFLCLGVVWESLRSYEISGVIEHLDKFREVELFCSYAGYFVAGYYIAHIGLSQKTRIVLYALGFISFLTLPVVSVYVSRYRQIPATAFSDSFSVFVCMFSAALFIAVSEYSRKKKISGISAGIISELGLDTLGVYLCHIALMERIPILRDWCDMLPSVIGMLIYSIILFGIGSIISAVLRRIPVIGRYIC